MAKIIALDVGTVRTGVAETDPFQIIATGLPTVATKDLLTFLKAYIPRENPEYLVVGEPKRMHGEASEVEGFISQKIAEIKKLFPALRIERMDERFTSKMAAQTIAQSNLKKKQRQNKALVDEVSAVLILQSWMSRRF
jgi:putative Holliday junction resolvase